MLVTGGKLFEAQVYVHATGHYEPQRSVTVELWSNLTSPDWSGVPFTKTPLENVDGARQSSTNLNDDWTWCSKNSGCNGCVVIANGVARVWAKVTKGMFHQGVKWFTQQSSNGGMRLEWMVRSSVLMRQLTSNMEP